MYFKSAHIKVIWSVIFIYYWYSTMRITRG